MTELGKAVSKLICVIKVKTGDDGKLFGTVTAGMIADELKHQFDIALDKKKIHLCMSWFMVRRFINWFPLGMTYAFLCMGRLQPHRRQGARWER
jgi:hypothetical protein